MSTTPDEPQYVAILAPYKLGNPPLGEIKGVAKSAFANLATGQWDFHGTFLASSKTTGEVMLSYTLRFRRTMSLEVIKHMEANNGEVYLHLEITGDNRKQTYSLTFP
jgi:hypothetical protein